MGDPREALLEALEVWVDIRASIVANLLTGTDATNNRELAALARQHVLDRLDRYVLSRTTGPTV